MSKDARPRGLSEAYNYPCPICTGVEFDWGTLASTGVSFLQIQPFVGFKADQDVVQINRIYVRRCKKCGNLQQFA